MSRREKFLLQLIRWLAVGTFLFGILAMLLAIRKSPPAQTQPPAVQATSPAPIVATPR
jgi:hypothetical protein